jgi:hypothetical protein
MFYGSVDGEWDWYYSADNPLVPAALFPHPVTIPLPPPSFLNGLAAPPHEGWVFTPEQGWMDVSSTGP